MYNDYRERSSLQQVWVNPLIASSGFRLYGVVGFFAVVYSFDDGEHWTYWRVSNIKAFNSVYRKNEFEFYYWAWWRTCACNCCFKTFSISNSHLNDVSFVHLKNFNQCFGLKINFSFDLKPLLTEYFRNWLFHVKNKLRNSFSYTMTIFFSGTILRGIIHQTTPL